MCRADSQQTQVRATPLNSSYVDLNQLLAGPTGQQSPPQRPPPAADIEEPLGSGILNTVARAALTKHTGKHRTHDDELASL